MDDVIPFFPKNSIRLEISFVSQNRRDLKEGFPCVTVDQRGHRLSDKPAIGYSAQDLAEDVLALIKTLDAGPAAIVGHSLGAHNAVVAAVINPALVRSV